jgi:hypothetical protein
MGVRSLQLWRLWRLWRPFFVSPDYILRAASRTVCVDGRLADCSRLVETARVVAKGWMLAASFPAINESSARVQLPA